MPSDLLCRIPMHVSSVRRFACVALSLGLLVAVISGCSGSKKQWYKGNTHTHTWWSDGDSPPEIAAAWYKDHDYHFLVLSDHNIMSEGEKWIAIKGARQKQAAVCEERFGSGSIETRVEGDKTLYRCKTLDEIKTQFEESGRFLLIPGEEITDGYEKAPIHLNGVNLAELVPPQHGNSIQETLQNNVDAVNAQERAIGQPMLVHVNHPNFGWALTAEHIAHLRDEQFFEVYNGHGGVRNYGDESHPSTETMWDIILTLRLTELGLPVMYGLATDDAHNFIESGKRGAPPGRGWVMVRAQELTPESIVTAIEQGDFYASTGVVLKDVSMDHHTLSVEIEPEEGVSYKTQFIGTLKESHGTDTGKVLAEQEGIEAEYRLAGNELYVRAKVISDKPHPNPHAAGDVEVAWTQPMLPE